MKGKGISFFCKVLLRIKLVNLLLIHCTQNPLNVSRLILWGDRFTFMDISFFKSFKTREKMDNKHVRYKILFVLVTIILFFILCAFFCDQYYNTENDTHKVIYPFAVPVGGTLEEGDVIEQDFSFYGNIRGVQLTLGTYGKKIKGNLSVELWQDDVKLAQGKKDLSKISDCVMFEVPFDTEVLSHGQEYTLKLKVSGIKKSNEMIFLGEDLFVEKELEEKQDSVLADENNLGTTDEEKKAISKLQKYLQEQEQEQNELSEALWNGEKIDATIGMEIVGYPDSLITARETFITTAVLLGLATVIFEVAILFFHFKVENLFLIIAVGLSFFYQFILIPISVPDEDAHLTMSYYYSDVLMGKDSSKELIELSEKIQKGQSDTKIFTLSNGIHRDSYLKTLSLLNEKDVHILTVHARQINATAISYIPSILGVSLGRLLGLPFLQVIYLGRFFEGFAYILLCYAGIRKIPQNKATLALISLLPISLHLANSFSYDSLLLGGAIFYTGFIFYLYQKKKQVSFSEIILLLMCILILTSGKGIYGIMLGMILLIPMSVWGGKVKQKLYLTALGSVSVLSFVVNMGLLLMVRGENSSAGINMKTSIIWEKPIEFFFLFINTLLQQADFYFHGILGGYLGWFQVNLPMVVSVFTFLLLLISILYRPGHTLELKPVHRAAGIAICILMSASFFAAAISWNEVDAEVIGGVQGRYFLSVLALFLCSISGCKQIELKKDVNRYLILGITGVNVFTLLFTLNAFLKV